MKRKKMEKEVVHLLEWIIEYPGVWQIVCNPDGKETSPESFKMAYDMLVKKSLFLYAACACCFVRLQHIREKNHWRWRKIYVRLTLLPARSEKMVWEH